MWGGRMPPGEHRTVGPLCLHVVRGAGGALLTHRKSRITCAQLSYGVFLNRVTQVLNMFSKSFGAKAICACKDGMDELNQTDLKWMQTLDTPYYRSRGHYMVTLLSRGDVT